jgi:hypothetical protein
MTTAVVVGGRAEILICVVDGDDRRDEQKGVGEEAARLT